MTQESNEDALVLVTPGAGNIGKTQPHPWPAVAVTRYDAVEEQLLALITRYAETYPGLSLSRSDNGVSATAQIVWGVNARHVVAAATTRVDEYGGSAQLAAQAALAALLESARRMLPNPPQLRRRVFRAVVEITADNESVNGGADGFQQAPASVDDVTRFLCEACSPLDIDRENYHDPVGITAIEIDWDTLTEIPTEAPIAPNGAGSVGHNNQ